MDTNKNSKKIVLLGIILLIIAGVIVVALRGFNVSLLFGNHESIELKIGSQMDINKCQEICNEIFAEKEFVLKELEVFGNSIQINVTSITDDEKTNLVNKINESFGTEKTVEDLRITSVSNKRIRDAVKPYIVPGIVAFCIIFVYMYFRFKKINSAKIIIDCICKIVLTELILLSVIAIGRIPVDDSYINLLILIATGELVFWVNKAENDLAKTEID